MNDWEKIDEMSLPGKKDFYSSLNMKGITGRVFRHVKVVWEHFEIENRRLS